MCNVFTLKQLDFTDIDKRKRFIKETESGLYYGVDVNGKNVIVYVQQKEEMSVKWENDNGWFESLVYDNNGLLIDNILEKIE